MLGIRPQFLAYLNYLIDKRRTEEKKLYFFFGGNDPKRINHIEVDGEKQKNKVKLLVLFLNVMNCVCFQLAWKWKKKILVEIFIVTLTGCQEMFLVSTSLLLHSLSLYSPSPTLSQPKKIIQTQTNKK